MANQFGDRVRQLREQQNLLLRQVAPLLEIDTPLLSKIERGERMAKKEQVIKLAEILKVYKDELLTLWLADQIVDIANDEEVALKAMQVAEDEIIYRKSKEKQKMTWKEKYCRRLKKQRIRLLKLTLTRKL
ncbi:MAG: helix-turn-helix transcriptional regulator [Chitinophagaceae bacterium]|nr:helix-turn-helix transcriptional regulator [Chitinophagaceae bacterium]